jgi:NADPH:quinone reductase-like Zn-dependent oxidoreductase
MDKVIELLKSSRIEVTVAKCFPMQQASAAHDFIESRKAIGKVVLFPDEDIE